MELGVCRAIFGNNRIGSSLDNSHFVWGSGCVEILWRRTGKERTQAVDYGIAIRVLANEVALHDVLHVEIRNKADTVLSYRSGMGAQIVNHLPGISAVVGNAIQTADEEGSDEVLRLEILTVFNLQSLQFLNVARQGVEGEGDLLLTIDIGAFLGSNGDGFYGLRVGRNLLDGQ